MFDKICNLIYSSLKEPVKIYDAWIPIVAAAFAILWMPASFTLMLLFETKVLEAQLSLPYRILFFFVVLLIGLFIDYFVMLGKLAKSETRQHIKEITEIMSFDATQVRTLTPEETEQFFKSLSANHDKSED